MVRKRFERKHFGRERDRGRHGNYNLGSPTTRRRFSTPLLDSSPPPCFFSYGLPSFIPSFSPFLLLSLVQVGRFKPIRCGEKETLGEGRLLILASYDSVDVGQCFSTLFFSFSFLLLEWKFFFLPSIKKRDIFWQMWNEYWVVSLLLDTVKIYFSLCICTLLLKFLSDSILFQLIWKTFPPIISLENVDR